MIIGAGPAGLTTALELLRRTGIQPLVLEKSAYMGGISRTVAYKGNRIDIGGHRFFSKSDRVMDWWTALLPVEQDGDANHRLVYQNRERVLELKWRRSRLRGGDLVMLVRPRKSRIFYLRKTVRLSAQAESRHAAKARRDAHAQSRFELHGQRDAAHSAPKKRSRIS